MNDEQRAAALRLADSLQIAENLSGRMQAIEFLRALAAEPLKAPLSMDGKQDTALREAAQAVVDAFDTAEGAVEFFTGIERLRAALGGDK